MLKNGYTKKAIDSTPRDMHEAESIERLIEGLKVAASCAKEMTALEPENGWGKVAEGLVHLGVSCRKLAKQKAVTRGQLLLDADQVQKRLGTDSVTM